MVVGVGDVFADTTCRFGVCKPILMGDAAFYVGFDVAGCGEGAVLLRGGRRAWGGFEIGF